MEEYASVMEYTRLGNAKMKVSRICLGCMSFGKRVGVGFGRWLKMPAARLFNARLSFDFVTNIGGMPDDYRAMSERTAIKAMIEF